MQYFSIDIETTGLNPEKDQILQIGIAYENTKRIVGIDQIPCDEILIKWDRIEGDPFAINMNRKLIEQILHPRLDNKITHPDNIQDWLLSFISKQHRNVLGMQTINVAGKNFNGFDRLFLEKYIEDDRLRFHRRVLDPAMICVDWDSDKVLPNLQRCIMRSEIHDKVQHTAMQDAIDVIRVIRKATNMYLD